MFLYVYLYIPISPPSSNGSGANPAARSNARSASPATPGPSWGYSNVNIQKSFRQSGHFSAKN